jgi:hypothetical protein
MATRKSKKSSSKTRRSSGASRSSSSSSRSRKTSSRKTGSGTRKTSSRGGSRRYGSKAQSKVARAMHERKHGELRSGRSGRKVTSRKQAIAIGLSEARKRGAKVPKKRSK